MYRDRKFERDSITGGWAFALGGVFCLLLFFAVIAPAFAVGTGGPTDCYRDLTAAERAAVQATGFYQGYAGRDEARLKIFTHNSDRTAFYFVRMESRYCNGNRCMTGIFKGDLSGWSLQSWGALPALTKIGVGERRMCADCAPINPVEFYLTSDAPWASKKIFLWRHGVFFGGR